MDRVWPTKKPGVVSASNDSASTAWIDSPWSTPVNSKTSDEPDAPCTFGEWQMDLIFDT